MENNTKNKGCTYCKSINLRKTKLCWLRDHMILFIPIINPSLLQISQCQLIEVVVFCHLFHGH